MLAGADLVFITAGMGGGTGTGAAPIVAEIAKEMGILTVGIVTKPFLFEGKARSLRASKGIERLKSNVDDLIVVLNDNLLKITDSKITLDNAFSLADNILEQGITSITDLLTSVGEVNIDFADIKTTMNYRGKAYMGIGRASGEKKVEEAEVCFLMDRFGYMRLIDKNAYERNKDAAHAESRYVFTCMNTDKICIFTDTGKLHTVKAEDIPLVRFRDKGVPADNLGNYDSTSEQILYVAPLSQVAASTVLFVTENGMCKLVKGEEFRASKRTIVSTKLAEDDRLVFVGAADEMDQVVFQSEKGYFLRIMKTEISVTKKNAMGVRGMKLTGEDRIHHAYLLESRQEYAITYHDKPYVLNKVKLAKRDTKGVKPRI